VRLRVRWELQEKVAQRLVTLLLPPEPVLRDPLGDFRVFALAELLDDLVERLGDVELWQIAPARLAGVERVVVQLDALLADAAVDHPAEPAVADRQRFDPFRRRRVVPQDEVAIIRRRRRVDRERHRRR
jgi:hypothetical protein